MMERCESIEAVSSTVCAFPGRPPERGGREPVNRKIEEESEW